MQRSGDVPDSGSDVPAGNVQARVKARSCKVFLYLLTGKVIATIGQNDAADQTKSNKAKPDIWQGDKFYAVHGVTYDKQGNLLVTEFNQYGRMTKVKRE